MTDADRSDPGGPPPTTAAVRPPHPALPGRADAGSDNPDADTGSGAGGGRGEDLTNAQDGVVLGEDSSMREVARAARHALLSPDLLRSGPWLWPFGRRARDRRARELAIAAEARRRRDTLRTAFDTAFGTVVGTVIAPPGTGRAHGLARTPVRRRRVDRSTRAGVIIALAGMVVTIAVAAWVASEPGTDTTATPPTAPQRPAAVRDSSTAPRDTTTAGGSIGAALPARPPIPPGGVAETKPLPGLAVDPATVRVVPAPAGDPAAAELATPEGAMRAWLARSCPFTHGEEFGAQQQRARAAVTDTGWSILNPYDGDERDQQERASWEKTRAAGESGRCSAPTALISPQVPRSPDTAIVIGAITRIITSPGQPAYGEALSVVWRVRQGGDGLWRLDLPTEGG